MTVILARAKQAAKWAWAIAALTAVGVTWALWGWLRRPRGLGPAQVDPVDIALTRYDRRTAEATARAAVQIAAAQEKDHAVRAELLEVLALGDEDAAIDRLIAVGKRVRGER